MILARDMVSGVKLPPLAHPEERRSLTHEEARAFLREARADHYWPLWLLYLETGLRRGDGLGLR